MENKQRITGSEIIQPRAVKTREKLLRTAIKLYSKKGYHNTTVDEIAKNTGLSVGSAYRYFKDKKELLLAALEYCFSQVTNFDDVSETDMFGKNLERALLTFEKIHMEYYDLHEELEGLRHTDKDVCKLYNDFAEIALKGIYERLPKEMKEMPHTYENLKITIGLMENHCHYYMHEKTDEEKVLYMRKRTVELVNHILTSREN